MNNENGKMPASELKHEHTNGREPHGLKCPVCKNDLPAESLSVPDPFNPQLPNGDVPPVFAMISRPLIQQRTCPQCGYIMLFRQKA